MTPTNNQIVAEAKRRARERGWGAPPVEHYIIEVVRENWTPPKPVDPDVQAFRKWRAGATAGELREPVDAYLAGARMAREQANVLLETLDDIRQHGPNGVSRQASTALAAYKAGKEAAR
jgi:hypothetical protein